jgi:hypothetical protein
LNCRIHSGDVAVAGLTRDASQHVALVREPNIVGQIVYAKPGNRLLVFPVLEKLHDLWSLFGNREMALRAALN